MAKVFCDLHHSGLYTSLQYLFEKRLGYELFRPIGESWYKEGFWLLAKPYNDASQTITQYLGIRDEVYHPIDGTRPLNEIKGKDGYYTIRGEPFDHKAVTFEQFKEMDIDIVIASYAPHIPVYAELIKKYKPKAKLIHQQGNEWVVDFSQCKNLLASVLPYKVPNDVNAVFYHQEFDLDTYCYTEPQEKEIIRSFVNCLSSQDMFKEDWDDFCALWGKLKGYKFESYGAGCMNGTINSQKQIADLMKESLFGFHCKTGGDGYGHIIHNFFAVGRPVIYRGSQYKDRLASLLLEHKVTGIDLDQMSIENTALFIRNITNIEYEEMCNQVISKFEIIVDFDKEENQIREFLERLR